jgi:phage-related protein
MKWEIEFYTTPEGKEVIAEFLDSLPRKHRAKALWEIDLLAEYGPELKEPYAKHIEGLLWELRIQYSADIARVFYFIHSQTKIVLLHGFVKKTQRIPPKEIKTASARLTDYIRRYSR